MEKGGTDIEGVVAKFQFRIAASYPVTFFHHGDLEAAIGESHRRTQTTRASSHNEDMLLLHGDHGRECRAIF